MKNGILKKGIILALSAAMMFSGTAFLSSADTYAIVSKDDAGRMEFVYATTEYEVGSAFKKDAKVKVYNADETASSTLSGSQLSYGIDDVDMRNPGTYTVLVAYGSQSGTSYTIEVKPKYQTMSITQNEERQKLYYGEAYSFNGIVTGKFGTGNDRYDEDITGSLTYKNDDTTKIGSRYVELVYKYCGKEKSIKNNVLTDVLYSSDASVQLKEINITAEPKKTFNAGDTFVFDGAVYATFSDGSDCEVITDALKITGASTDKNADEKQTVTVSFTYNGIERSTSYEITVNGVEKKDLTGLSITKDPTKTYNVDDAFSFDGEVSAKYSNGDTAVIDSSKLSVTAPDMGTAGSETITISYTENDVTKTTSYSITKKSKAPSVPAMAWKSINTKNAGKLTLNWKKALDVTGYQIQYSTHSNMSGKLTKWVKNPDATSATITNLTSGKTYYVRARAYIVQDGVKYYGKWLAKKGKIVS